MPQIFRNPVNKSFPRLCRLPNLFGLLGDQALKGNRTQGGLGDLGFRGFRGLGFRVTIDIGGAKDDDNPY